MNNPIGKRFELWQYEYVKDAYEDQMGRKHEANVVRRKVIITITETQPTVGEWSGQNFEDGLWIAKDESGVMYTQRLDETSMCGRYVWWDKFGGNWIPAQSRGWFIPYMNPDGTKAVPQVLDASPATAQ